MRRRQPPILFNGLLFFALTCVHHTAPAQREGTSGAREIAKLDREFSTFSVEKGMPAACLAYFAEDGVAFAPMAVDGRKYWSTRKEWTGTLVWQPIFAAASGAGDLGYTTGPWELQKKNGPGSTAFGNYVTVWRKRSGGEWKIALDVGTDNSQPTQPPPALQLLPADTPVGERSGSAARRRYHKAELAFSAAAREDVGKALIDFAAPEIRILRDKSFPAAGIPAAQIMLGSEHGKVVQEIGGTTLSTSEDFAYSYGNYSEERGNLRERGIYLMIWQTDLNGDWKVLLDLRKKVP